MPEERGVRSKRKSLERVRSFSGREEVLFWRAVRGVRERGRPARGWRAPPPRNAGPAPPGSARSGPEQQKSTPRLSRGEDLCSAILGSSANQHQQLNSQPFFSDLLQHLHSLAAPGPPSAPLGFSIVQRRCDPSSGSRSPQTKLPSPPSSRVRSASFLFLVYSTHLFKPFTMVSTRQSSRRSRAGVLSRATVGVLAALATTTLGATQPGSDFLPDDGKLFFGSWFDASNRECPNVAELGSIFAAAERVLARLRRVSRQPSTVQPAPRPVDSNLPDRSGHSCPCV